MNYLCPKCNAEFSFGTKFCQSCGYNLESAFTGYPICPKCYKTFSIGTRFCDIDGTMLTSSEKLIPKCVTCGEAYPQGTQFCPKDGSPVIPEAFRYTNPYPYQSFDGSYPKASLGNRFLASLLDSFIMIGLLTPALLFYFLGIAALASSTTDASILFFIIAVCLYILPFIYSFIKDGLGEGQSWGKKAVGLMVVHLPNNTPCTKGRSALRGLIGFLISFVPLGWMIEPIMVLATDDGRRLADRVANTQVIDKNLFHN